MISDEIGKTVGLKPYGEKRWVGPCPFHKEKTGSFVVDDNAGWWRCFGCGLAGDLEDFQRLMAEQSSNA